MSDAELDDIVGWLDRHAIHPPGSFCDRCDAFRQAALVLRMAGTPLTRRYPDVEGAACR